MRPFMTALGCIKFVNWDERIIIDVEYVDKFNLYLILRFL